jgi:outer membrane protein assembly factor BamC
LLSILLAAGCTSLTDKVEEMSKVDYKSAGTLPPLEIPPDLTAPARDNRYVVPESGKSSATLSGYEQDRRDRPVSTSVLPAVERMRVERSGNQRWLVVAQEPPEKLWPLVKDFWQENGFLIRTEVPEAGVMETDWAENRAKLPQDIIRETLGKVLDTLYSTSERDKFRTRLERTPEGTEIYISHRGMEEVFTSREFDPSTGSRGTQTVWQARPPDPGLEAEFLRRLMVRLGAQEERAKQLAGTGTQVALRAELKKTSDGQMLQVLEPFDRAWRRVGLALDRVGFTVEDRDRQKGVYFVRYADPEADMDRKDRQRGFLSRLFDWGSKESKLKAEQYRVQVVADKEASRVNVLNKDGAADSSTTAQRILSLLHEQLK